MNKLFLGDRQFNRKMMIYYAWITPVCFTLLTGLFLSAEAYVSAICVFLIVLLTLPNLRNINGRITTSRKVILSILFLFAAIYATGLYI